MNPSPARLALTLALASALSTTAPGVLALETLTIKASSIPVYYDLEASLEAVNQSTVSAQTSGVVKAIFFDVNDAVPAGSVLMHIDNIVQKSSVQQASARLEQARAQNDDAQVLLKRTQNLYAQKTVSQGEYDSILARAKTAQAAVKAAEAGLKQAKEQLEYTEIRAPYSGIVKVRHVEVGELVNPGQPLMTGIATSPLRALAEVPQSLAQDYSKAQISVWINGEAITPEKTTLFPFADASTHSIRLRAQLPETQTEKLNAYPGQWVKVRMQTGTRDTLLVPESAVLRRSELASVYVLHQGKPSLRQVRLGESFNGQIEVLAGLKVGEQILTDALAQLAVLSAQ